MAQFKSLLNRDQIWRQSASRSFGPLVSKTGKAAIVTTCTAVRKASGHKVCSYIELATKVAELQFLNREPSYGALS